MNKNPFKRQNNPSKINLLFWIIIDTIQYRIYPVCVNAAVGIGNFLRNRYESIQDKPEYEWAQPISGSFMRTIRLPSRVIFYTLVLLLTSFIVWGSFFQIDEYVHAQGEVDPESEIKMVNHLEGGVIREIFVKDGDHVQKGQLLMLLDNTIIKAAYQEALNNYYRSWAAIIRLKAQIDKKPLELSEKINNFSSQIAVEAQQAYQAHNDLIQKEEGALKDQLEESQIAVQEMEKKIKYLTNIRKIAERRAKRFKWLHEEKLVATTEYEQAEMEAEKQSADLDSSKINLNKLQAAVQEAQEKLSSIVVRYANQDWQYLEEQNRKFREAQKVIKLSQDRLKRNEIRAPVDGIIQQVVFKTLGASVPAGRELFTIIPDRDTLTVNAFVLPQDIGFVRVGQKVSIKISAFDYSIYGSLDGIVESISPDTFKQSQQQQSQPQPQPQQSFFRVRVRTSKDYIEYKGQKYRITSGMTTQVDIISGHRSVIYYLLKPLVKSTTSALHER